MAKGEGFLEVLHSLVYVDQGVGQEAQSRSIVIKNWGSMPPCNGFREAYCSWAAAPPPRSTVSIATPALVCAGTNGVANAEENTVWAADSIIPER